MNREHYEREIINKIKQRKFKEALRDTAKANICILKCECSSIEEHHLLSRINSDDTVGLCKPPHSFVTNAQNELPSQIRKNKSSKKRGLHFFLVSIGALLILIGERMIDFGLSDLDD
ncbi:MAG: hypothetical protein HYW23_00495 [Candidatus Aenigmarchaeota archaeon]|nr:hypothetical protein [Candidatus Aenigmarchaeota archaeon]